MNHQVQGSQASSPGPQAAPSVCAAVHWLGGTPCGTIGVMVKSTVYFDSATILALRQLAKAQGKSQAELIREAVTGYARRAGRAAPKGVGAYRSGRSDISEKAEALLRQAARRP